MNPSKAQLEILRRLAAGDTLHWMTGLNAHAFWGGNVSERSPNRNSIFALRDAGLIAEKQGTRKVSGWKYIITYAGRSLFARCTSKPT